MLTTIQTPEAVDLVRLGTEIGQQHFLGFQLAVFVVFFIVAWSIAMIAAIWSIDRKQRRDIAENTKYLKRLHEFESFTANEREMNQQRRQENTTNNGAQEHAGNIHVIMRRRGAMSHENGLVGGSQGSDIGGINGIDHVTISNDTLAANATRAEHSYVD